MRKLKRFSKIARVPILLCLMGLLSSCGSRTQTAYLFPPQAYLTPCERTDFNGSTYGDAIEHLLKVMSERDLCAGQVDKIREWLVKYASK